MKITGLNLYVHIYILKATSGKTRIEKYEMETKSELYMYII
jgi:hypothetical protein